MSLVSKMDEISAFISEKNLDLLFLTETWLRNTVEDTHMLLPYNLMRRDRTIGHHGSVCFYSKESIKVHRLHEFEDPNLEVFWTYIRPPRLPRGIPCIVNGTVATSDFVVLHNPWILFAANWLVTSSTWRSVSYISFQSSQQ